MFAWDDLGKGWDSARSRLRDAWAWGTEPEQRRQARIARRERLRHDPMFQAVRWTMLVVGGVVVALLIALATLDWNLLRGPAARLASARIGRAVHIDGNLHVNIWSLTPRVEVNGLRIANTDWAGGGDMAVIRHLMFDVKLLPLIGGHAVVPLIQAEHADIHLVRDVDGRANWNFGSAADNDKPMHFPPVRRFIVSDAKLSLVDRRRKLAFTGTINSNESAKGRQRGFWMTGLGTLNGNIFRADVHGAPLLNVDAAKPYPFTLDLHSGDTHVTASGTIAHPFDFGVISGKSEFSGNSLADLYYLTGLAFPSTPPYRLAADFRRDGETYRLDNLTGGMGKSDMSGWMRVDASGKPFLSAGLHSRFVNLDDLGFLFGGGRGRGVERKAPVPSKTPQPDSGTITVAGGNAPKTLFLPDTPLAVDRVRQMDARVAYDADRIVSQDLPLRRMSLVLSIRDGVMTVDPLAMTLVNGRIDGSTRIDASRDVPLTTLDLRLRNIALAQFIAEKNPPPLDGTLEARIKFAGTGNSVHKMAASANGTLTFVVPHGQMREAFAELMGINLLNGGWELLTNDKSPTNLRCMVASFDAHDGLLTAKRVTFDTDVVSATGKGTVNLKNETFDLTFAGEPKKLRIGRINAPIEVTGSLQSPKVGIDAGKALPQAGIGVALGAVFAPLAAILPFVDAGLAKDVDCGAIVAGAKARGAPVKARK
jgi:hypothetical protein